MSRSASGAAKALTPASSTRHDESRAVEALTPRLSIRLPVGADVADLAEAGLFEEEAILIPAEAGGNAVARVARALRAMESHCGMAMVIEERTGGGLVGWIEITLTRRRSDIARIALWISPSHRHTGLEVEACRAALPIAVRTFDVKALSADANLDDEGSRELLKRLGLKPVRGKPLRNWESGSAAYCKELIGIV